MTDGDGRLYKHGLMIMLGTCSCRARHEDEANSYL